MPSPLELVKPSPRSAPPLAAPVVVDGPSPVPGRRRWPAVAAGATLFLALAVPAAGAVAFHRSFRLYDVPSPSMAPDYEQGDRVLARVVDGGDVRVGDVVVFEVPRQSRGVTQMKRVIAVGPAVVVLRDGHVYVDDERYPDPFVDDGAITEPFARRPAPGEPDIDRSYPACTDDDPCEVPPDAVWVLGDNRAASRDSRTYGPVRRNRIQGRVVASLTRR